jgi:hypothetical protein
VEVVGESANTMHLLHARHHCRIWPLPKLSKKGTPKNKAKATLYCTLCWCYVCDVPVSQCGMWVEGREGQEEGDGGHCLATENGRRKGEWKRERSKARAEASAAGGGDVGGRETMTSAPTSRAAASQTRPAPPASSSGGAGAAAAAAAVAAAAAAAAAAPPAPPPRRQHPPPFRRSPTLPRASVILQFQIPRGRGNSSSHYLAPA